MGRPARPHWQDRLFVGYYRSADHPMKLRLERWLRRALALADVAAESPSGVRYVLTPEDFVQHQILREGTYEPETLRLVQRLLTPGGVMVDVGAHVGQYALHAARVVGPAGAVIAVEPNPWTYQRLLENIVLNNASCVRPILGAVGRLPEVAPMRLPPRDNWGMSQVAWGEGVPDYYTLAAPLGSILESARVGKVDVLKIDVEGFEEQVVRSIDFDSALRPAHIVFEFLPQLAARRGASGDTLLEFLSVQGYDLLDVRGAPIGITESPPLEDNIWARDGRRGAHPDGRAR